MTLPAPAVPAADGTLRTDVLIIGAGVAGLTAALHLPPGARTVVVDKGTPGGSGSSPWAQGGLAAAVGSDDSPALHAEDTLRAADGLADPVAVRALSEEAPERVRWLVELGARFDRNATADERDLRGLHLAREGGQRVARSVHTADATGAELIRVLRTAARDRIERLPGVVAELTTDGSRVTGALVVHPDHGPVTVTAGAILLATGGCGALYAATTNQDGATGDGVALAWRAGAAVRDLEFVQFHPTGLVAGDGGAWRFLLTEALRGAGATLHDADGDRFLTDRHPDAELAPRHVVARAILERPGGRAWLDATSIGAARLEHEFPTVLAGARDHGYDLATERVPVTPAAHYLVGGVRTDLDGHTSVTGLWAAGEVASTGVHGANRMAGNSLTEALVFGTRAARSIGADSPAPLRAETGLDLDPPSRDDRSGPRAALRAAMWQGAGPARTADGLRACLTRLDGLGSTLGGRPTADAATIELWHAIDVARLIALAALRRPETRGGHARTDHPDADPDWAGVHLETVRPG